MWRNIGSAINYLQRSARLNDVFYNAFENVRYVSTTAVLFGEPMKKKKKMDPQMYKLKVERRVKKLEKEVKKMKRTKKPLIPALEYQLSPEIMKDIDNRKRKDAALSEAAENAAKVEILWSVYRMEQTKQERISFEAVIRSQKKALSELRKVSENLYLSAIATDENFIPFSDEITVKSTPTLRDYEIIDGKRTDITREWKM